MNDKVLYRCAGWDTYEEARRLKYIKCLASYAKVNPRMWKKSYLEALLEIVKRRAKDIDSYVEPKGRIGKINTLDDYFAVSRILKIMEMGLRVLLTHGGNFIACADQNKEGNFFELSDEEKVCFLKQLLWVDGDTLYGILQSLERVGSTPLNNEFYREILTVLIENAEGKTSLVPSFNQYKLLEDIALLGKYGQLNAGKKTLSHRFSCRTGWLVDIGLVDYDRSARTYSISDHGKNLVNYVRENGTIVVKDIGVPRFSKGFFDNSFFALAKNTYELSGKKADANEYMSNTGMLQQLLHEMETAYLNLTNGTYSIQTYLPIFVDLLSTRLLVGQDRLLEYDEFPELLRTLANSSAVRNVLIVRFHGKPEPAIMMNKRLTR